MFRSARILVKSSLGRRKPLVAWFRYLDSSFLRRSSPLYIRLIDGVILKTAKREPIRCYAWAGEMSVNVAAMIRAILKPGDKFLDIGAYHGQHSIRAARLGARVVAFEPDPRSVTRLRENAVLSGVGDGVEVREQAVSNSVGNSTFVLNQQPSMSSLSGLEMEGGPGNLSVGSVPARSNPI